MDNKVKSPFRRILSLLLCISMVLTCSVSVNAADVVQAVNELTTTAADEASTEAAETDGLTDSEETDETTIPAETDESTTSAGAKETTGSANTETTAETAATEKTTEAAVTEKETKATESENTTEATVMSVNEDDTEAQTDETIYILAGGDYQEAGDHTASSENVTNILNTIYSAGYTTMDGFLFIGDYDCETHEDATETASGINSLMATVQAKYSNINHDNTVLAQGNHDYADSRIDATGGHDFDGYSAFVLNEDDYANYGGTEFEVKALAANLETWLNDKIEAGFDKPIFIVSHLPLAFGPRTNFQGDAKYAKYLFDVLNAGGEAGLNIIFLHGHNHAYGYDNYLGGEAIYLPKGDKINIAEVGSNSSYTTETLNFTYMNAGYTGYYNESGYTTSNKGTDKLTMTVFAIADNKVTVGRYSADGAYNLKSIGRSTGDYISNVSVTANTDTYRTTQTIELTAPAEKTSGDIEEAPATSVNNWIEVQEAGTQYKYVLDTDGYDTGSNNKYLIVGSNADVALSNSVPKGVKVTVSDNAIILYTRDYEWYINTGSGDWGNSSNSNTGYLVTKGSQSIDDKDGLLTTSRFPSKWQITHKGSGQYNFKHKGSSASWYMYWNGSNFGVSSASSSTVRLFKYDGTVTSNVLYAKIGGETLYQVNSGTTADEALAAVKAGITGYTNTSNSDSGITELDDSDLTWTWVDTYDSSTAGYYTVQISYEGKVLGTVEVQVVKKSVSSFSLTSDVGYVNQYASATAQVKDADGNVIYVTTHYTDGTTSKAPLTVAMLSAPETKVAGVKNNQTVTYGSYEITSKFKLNVIEKVVDNYPDYPDEGAVKVNKTGTGIDFQSSGIAQVELSASGVPSKKGADVIVMLDTSSSMESWCVECNAKFSSSTCNHDNQKSTYSRAAVLEESLKDLIAQFKTPGDDGELLDIRVAIADFNGFYGEKQSKSDTAYDRDAADMMADDIYYNASSEAQVYTGDGSLGAGAFVDAADLKTTYTLNYTSGTNYDYAFDAIYQMGTAIKAANGDEERDLYVIFMSDGAAMQWNYYHSQGASSLWNSWITGVWSENDLTSTKNLNCREHKYYYNTVDTNGDGRLNEHRMANAIKGDTDSTYEVIRKTSDLGTAVDGYNDLYMVPGLGATMFSIAFDPVADDQVTAASMETSIATIASEQADNDTTQYYYRVEDADALSSAFNTIGSEIAYAAYNARFVDTMGEDYDIQLEPVNYKSEGSKVYDTTITPTIEVKSYTIWTRAEYEAGNCTENQIGQRKTDSNGNYIYTVLETVTFTSTSTVNEYGQTIYTLTGAYSDQVDSGETNILADDNDNSHVAGVIYAKNFLYNTNTETVTVNGITIAGETFYWKLGTITTSELALSYYVYLTGSMEGEREAGSYPTNESAVLYYDNYLGNACEKATVSPVLAWKSANVSYAFYLVNAQGQPVNMDGTVVTFANRVTIVNPTLYDEVLLNSGDNVQSLKVASSGVLPSGYALYDYSAKYTVTINSNSTGSWEIVVGTDEDSNELTHTTYVTDYSDTEQYTNETSVEDVDHDYTHTTVWFAVVWEPQALPDTVVIDYGLPVDIHVMTNDMFGSFGKLIGVAKGEVTNSDNDNSTNEVTDTKVAGKYGTAEVIVPKTGANESNSVIRYTPSKMEMNGYDVFTYSVNYNNTELTNNNGYYYNTVTVIPATTIYYEDSFLEYTGYTWDNTQNGWVENTEKKFWTKVTDSTYNENTVITQDEDRPDDVKYAFDTIIDANNVYGYDSAYTECSQYSLGSAMKATVDYDNYAEASFKFYGTGFDVISLTSNATGTIYVDVYALDGDGNRADKATANYIVDTYYGYISSYYEVTYTYGENGWTVYSETKVDALGSSDTVPESPAVGDSYTVYETRWETVTHSLNALYQVPVMQVEDLDYGHYEAVIKALYEPAFDHVDSSASDGSYDFYLDAIRIYDPANDGASDGTDDVTIENAYSADNESYPIYKELRNLIIDANSFGSDVTVTKEKASATTAVNGVVFIDSNSSVGNAQISDYVSYGPNNELYLAPGQAIAFKINDVFVDSEGNSITPVDVQLGIKSVGGSASIEMFNPGIKVTTTTEETTTTTTSTATKDNLISKNLDTATDMYYSIKALINGTIVISNPATSGTISITNLKFTFAKKATVKTETTPNEETGEEETNEASVASISEEGVVFSLRSLSAYSVSETVENAPEVFEPETFEVSVNKTSVKVGQKVKVTVTTSDDVAYITINGDVINNYKNNKKTGLRTWTVQLDATEVGELDIEVVAFSDEDIASEPIAKQITVNAKNSGKKK